ncbi:MAG: lipid-binding protein [Paludibacter sp.]|nr:lipid-binding protein [Paludibacter sp.]
MKKIIYLFIAVVGLIFTSCEKDEIGGTTLKKMAGEWYVTAVAVNDDDSVIYSDDDLFGLGTFEILTYNSSSNSDTMFVDDKGVLWDFKVKAKVDLAKSIFLTPDTAANYNYNSGVLITNGKIIYGAAKTPSGMPADSIVFNVWFDDDDYPETYGYTRYRVAGYRRTGFAADEP